ncbi:centromere protein T isoform X2 [Ochotona princeps]|uniref:centromere protein T isoform X2 n=1 Tax=Ochotona princeps TaxID=9978 RepID=UPI002714704E|nr:centromere protein T isoform X2 [Ochotona princeps]
MADSYSPNSEPTTRTLLRRVLDTADSRSPRRRLSVRAGTQRTLPETRLSWRLRSQTKPTTKRRSHGTRSPGRPAHSQARRHLEEQTPRTLFQNILRTAPESSILKPESTGKPVPAPTAAQPPRRESSRSSLELQLPELEPSTSPAPALLAPGRRKQRVRLSMFERQVDQGQPVAQEPQETADASSLTSSLNLNFATPLQPQSVKRPGLARKPPPRRAVDVGLLLQDLRDASFAPTGNSLRTSVTTVPTDTALEDTQPFSQPLVSHSPAVPHFLPHPSHNENEDAERTVSHRTQSSQLGLQSDELQPWPAATPEVTEAVGSQDAAEAEELDVPSGEEDPSDSTAGPEMASSNPRSLQAEQPPLFSEPPPRPDATLSSQAVPARPPPRHRAAGHRPRPDPYKTGLNHYTKLFRFYAKMPMEKAALGMVEKCLDKYFHRLCDDLEVFAAHAGRKTVKPEDLELLMRRQGLVTDQVSLHVLVERHLPLEYRKLLIPCAFSGNSVFPAQ